MPFQEGTGARSGRRLIVLFLAAALGAAARFLRKLSLQLAMLAYVDEEGRLRIGAGVPREWLLRPMRVAGILTRRGVADWSWDGTKLAAALDGRPVEALPGPAFAAQR